MFRCIAVLVTLLFVSAASAQTNFPSDSRLASVASTKTVKIGYRADAKPFSFVNKGAPAGFTIDLCKLVVASIRQQLGLDDLKIEWVPLTIQTRFSAVAEGKADMECGSSTVTLGRMKEVDFSSIVFVQSTGIVVAKASGINSFSQMGGKKIAVISGTTNEQAVVEQLKRNNVAATVTSVKDSAAAVAMLEAGSVDAFASDKMLLVGVGAGLRNPDAFVMLPDDLSVEPYAIALPRGDWAFRLAVNTGLAEIYGSGRIATIFKHWFDEVGLKMGPVFRTVYILGALAQ